MIEKSLTVVNKLGLHARASAKLVNLTNRYQSKINIRFRGNDVNAKSLLGLLTLAAGKGSQVLVTLEGEDEEPTLRAITKLFEERFGEKE